MCRYLKILAVFLLISCPAFSQDSAKEKQRVRIIEFDPVFFITDSTINIKDYVLNRPRSLTVDDEGSIYIYDFGESCIAKFNSEGKYLFKWGSPGVGPGEIGLSGDAKLFYCCTTGKIYFTDSSNHRVQVFDKNGRFLKSIRTERYPFSVSVDSKGNIYVGMSAEKPDDFLVHVYSNDGKLIGRFGKSIKYVENPLKNAPLIVHDERDNLYMVFKFYAVFRKYDPSGKLIFEQRLVNQLSELGCPAELLELWRKEPMKLDEPDNGYSVFGENFFFKNGILCISFPVNMLEMTKEGKILSLYKYIQKEGHYYLPIGIAYDEFLGRYIMIISGREISAIAFQNPKAKEVKMKD